MTFSPVYSLRRFTFQWLCSSDRDGSDSGDRPSILLSRKYSENYIEDWKVDWAGKMSWFRPYLAGMSLAIALVSIACASIFIVIAEESLNPVAIAFNRLLISGLVFGTWRYITTTPSTISQTTGEKEFQTEKSTSGQWQTAGLLLLAGISFAGSLGSAAWSLTQTTVANSTLLNNMMPLFTTLGAWLLLGQTFSRRFVMGLVVAIAGVITLGLQDLHMASDQLLGDGSALLAAIFLATTILCIERLRAVFSTPTTMTGLSLVGTLVLLPIALLSTDPLFPVDLRSGLAVVALALVSQVLGHGLLAYSLKQLSSGLVSVLMLTIPVMSAILAALLFGQHLGWINGIAFMVVLSGIYLAVAQPKLPTE